ncbi:hypothetical protein [Clostridium colicanis]|uniref:DUF8042 domain-containing protein n=1 Tax=Clostridium colicanis DSM 13634 TaxID=1121305 RepID=A0A151AR18_9CLOT|nr:hypothetical protein [Clostridium colicanis]KYH30066.1 hypothetical protein CLCOL_00040 [Clostridium colicanis DSM 13634]
MLNREVIKQILDLLETMEEGVDYVKVKLGELNIEGTVIILTDLITAFIEIEKNILSMMIELPENKIKEKTEQLRTAFDTMVKEYETSKGQRAYEIIQFTLEPSFKQWKDELENILKPYILS